MSRTSYLDVKAVILGRIRGGELVPGDTVPGEAALAGEFGCARVTVNRPIIAVDPFGQMGRALVRGLIGAGVGPFVERGLE